ncbi:MAG: hypothetical protein ACKOWO_07975 [Sediminibacterium sp.]
MKAITIYQCNDGTRFDAENDAKEYESLCDEVKRIMEPMGERTHKCDIGEEYIQHDPKDVKKALHDFLILCANTLTGYCKPLMECAKGKRHISHANYIISECGFKTLSDANYRFRCTNMESGREYQQPYYAKHENEFKAK